ncbi:MAG: RNA polymerase factor sigma-54 [Planctomycetes bacterium]|nr:RNA polymerase factor sigma-54 [Planctomycetota bacterium]
MAMQLRQNLNMSMQQKLKLTPQMIQSIEILLLPQMALEERIMQEIESNPALEIVDGPDEDYVAPESTDSFNEGSAETAGLTERIATADTLTFDRVTETQSTSTDDMGGDQELYVDFLKQRSGSSFDEDAPDKMAAINATAERPKVLAEHILDQLRFMDVSEEARELFADLCWQLDNRGFMTVSLEELFDEDQLDTAEEAWEVLRRCDPLGVGARDLADCLEMQLIKESGDNEFELQMIRNHLDDVLRNRLPVIAAAMHVDVHRIQEGVEVIGKLDPHPGMPFTAIENQYVIPDITVERDKDGEWELEIPDSHLPKVQVNDTYVDMLDSEYASQRDKAYLKEQMSSARFIIDAVAQRKRTLLRITREIIKHQKAFLEQGPEQLRPLMRQNIADKIGMHVATVSRAVKDKYIQTPSGVKPLAAFFSGGIASQDGTEGESSRAVRLRIAKMIENEEKRKPLSDQALADILAKEGLDISRRTVTKYRIADGIPSTRQRRVY